MMSSFGQTPYAPPRWIAVVVVAAAVFGVILALWLFGAVT